MSGMPEEQLSRLLFESPLVRVYDVVCRAPRSNYGPVMFNAAIHVGLPRRGVFVLARRGSPVVVDTTTALVLGLDEEYRISHPTGDGDDGTVLALPTHLAEDVIGGIGGQVGNLGPRDHLAVCLVTRLLAEPDIDQLEAEDATLLLLASLSRAFAGGMSARGWRTGSTQRLRVERARALLASSPATRWDLDTLGRVLYCSPFHLARQFRALTGETISRYLLRLRLGLAIERLAEGERDIAALASDIGFAHHSHFSARFRTIFGITPTQAREMLTKRNLDELRTLVADPGLAPGRLGVLRSRAARRTRARPLKHPST